MEHKIFSAEDLDELFLKRFSFFFRFPSNVEHFFEQTKYRPNPPRDILFLKINKK